MKKMMIFLTLMLYVSATNLSAQNTSTAEKEITAENKNSKQQDQIIAEEIHLPCEKEALDTDPQFISGFGIGEPKEDPGSKAEARRNAISEVKLEISSKWMGMIDSVIERYIEQTDDTNEDKEKLKNTLKISGEKAINQFIMVICSRLTKEKEIKRTSITYYIAAKVPISEVVKTIVSEGNNKGVKVNEKKMKEAIIKINPTNI